MLPPQLQHLQGVKIPVLDAGYIQVLDAMGDDLTVVESARVSYGVGTRKASEDRHLIRYLMRHYHTTPFEMCEIRLLVKVPMDSWRQWIRTRTANVNEYSTRYSIAIDDCQSSQGVWRSQSENNKQGSEGIVSVWPENFCRPDSKGGLFPLGGWVGTDYYSCPADYLTRQEDQIQRDTRAIYEERLKFGVSREQARKDLPLSNYTEAIWKIDLHNCMNFLRLRMDPLAQEEIRLYANALGEIVKAWVPWVWEAYEEYRLYAKSFSRSEMEGLRAILQSHPGDVIALATEKSGLKGRELKEMIAKLDFLLQG